MEHISKSINHTPAEKVSQPAQQETAHASSFQFKDIRPEASVQRNMQSLADYAAKKHSAVQFKTAIENTDNPIQKKNTTGMPDKLKSGVENLSGINMSDVKVHYNSSQPAQLNAHAYAQGTNIHIAPGQEKHLPHEAWHVVQQKQGRVKPTMQMKQGVPVNDDTGLEKEADVMGAKALNITQMVQETNIKLDPVATEINKGKDIAQRVINVGGNPLAGPADALWGLSLSMVALYNYMENNGSPAFNFPSQPKMLDFVKRYAALYEQNGAFFTQPMNVRALEPIISATPGAITETRAVINGEINITTQAGNLIVVHPFASKNRHLLTAFKDDQARPRAAKVSNSIVKWNYKFKEKFSDFISQQAQAIMANNILMGFEPDKVVHADAEITFHSDQPELPNTSYDRINALHSFPESGTGLAALDQNQFAAISKILSHIYSTDNYGLLRVSNPAHPAIPNDPVVIGNQRNLETAINVSITNLRRLGVPQIRPVDLNQAAANLAQAWQVARGTHYNPSLKSAIQDLHRLLVGYNVTSEIDPLGARLLVTVNEAVAAYDALDANGRIALKFLEPTIDKQVAASRLIIASQANVPPTINNQVRDAKAAKVSTLINAANVAFTLGNFYDLYEAAGAVGDPAATPLI